MIGSIIKAKPQQAELLSNLAFRSKAYWGYSSEFMNACRTELTYSENEISKNHCYCLLHDGVVSGFYILKQLNKDECDLDALFIDPLFIDQGFGRILIEHTKTIAFGLGIKKIIIQGDPNAERFYLAVGAVQVGVKESGSIPGRDLPMFVIRLD